MRATISMLFIANIAIGLNAEIIRSTNDKSIFCPKTNEFKVEEVGTNQFRYLGINQDGKSFYSQVFTYVGCDNPINPLALKSASYDQDKKELSCKYMVYSFYSPFIVINTGDY